MQHRRHDAFAAYTQQASAFRGTCASIPSPPGAGPRCRLRQVRPLYNSTSSIRKRFYHFWVLGAGTLTSGLGTMAPYRRADLSMGTPHNMR